MDDKPKKQQEAVTGQRLIGIIVGTSICLAIGIFGSRQRAIIPTPNTSVPADSIDLAVALVLLSVMHCLGSVFFARRERGQKPVNLGDRRVPLRRPRGKIGSRFLRFQVALLLVLFVYFNEQSWTAATVGFMQEFPGADFACGFFAYGLLLLILGLLFRMRGISNEQADNTMNNMAALWPREPRQKLAMTVAVCVINPITEELLFRGILVYQLGLAIGDYELPICLGLVVTLWNHAYQGQRSMLFHTLYYVFAVALLFSPAGMMGAIGMHYAGDIVPVSLMKTNLKRYRERHRRQAKQVDEALPIPQIEV